MFDRHLGQWRCIALQCLPACGIRIEVRRRYPPGSSSLLEWLGTGPCVAIAQAPQRLGPRSRLTDRFGRFGARVSRCRAGPTSWKVIDWNPPLPGPLSDRLYVLPEIAVSKSIK